MTIHELYLGGARQQNTTYAMLPSAPFNVEQPFQPAINQIPVSFFLPRRYDFGNDVALQNWNANLTVPLASGDILGSVVIPSDFLALGVYWKIDYALASGQFAMDTRNGGTSLV